MNTIDKIQRLLAFLNLPPFHYSIADPRYKKGVFTPGVKWTPGHNVLDTIDRHAGIVTRKTFESYSTGAGYTWRPALLGERVRRLERHVFSNPAPAYFHLGAEADKAPCKCSCH
jgi:hypothetical protein